MDLLIVAQTIFYLTVSAAIIVLGVLFAIVTYHLIKITRELEEISRDFHDASGEAGERIREIVERLSELPVLSFFLKQTRREESRRKGRKKSSKT